MKLPYLVGSWSKQHIAAHDLLVANMLDIAAPELFTFPNYTVEHKKTIINITIYIEILQK